MTKSHTSERTKQSHLKKKKKWYSGRWCDCSHLEGRMAPVRGGWWLWTWDHHLWKPSFWYQILCSEEGVSRDNSWHPIVRAIHTSAVDFKYFLKDKHARPWEAHLSFQVFVRRGRRITSSRPAWAAEPDYLKRKNYNKKMGCVLSLSIHRIIKYWALTLFISRALQLNRGQSQGTEHCEAPRLMWGEGEFSLGNGSVYMTLSEEYMVQCMFVA